MNKNIYKEKNAEKLDPEKDFYDVSAIWGKKPALVIVKWIYHTPVTPPQVTMVAFFFGLLAAYFLSGDQYASIFIGAILIQVKNIFDTVDGHLARARKKPSRIGRFLDSIVDIITNFLFFAAICFHLKGQYPVAEIWILSIFAFLSSQLQCSYYVFYTISYINFLKKPTASRVDESINFEDNLIYKDPKKQKFLIILQKIFLFLFGWQDKLMMNIDSLSLKFFDNKPPNWYLNKNLLTMTSWLGLGNQLILITGAAIFNQLYLYLWFVIIGTNLFWIYLLFYRIYFFNKVSERK